MKKEKALIYKYLGLFSLINFFIDLILNYLLGDGEHLSTVIIDSTLFTMTVIPLVFLSLIKPISKRIKENEETRVRLQEALKELSSITDAASDAIIMMNEEGNIIFWNKASEVIFGYSSKEVMGKQLHEMITPEKLRERFLKSFKKLKEDGWGNGLSNKTFELLGLDNTGREFPIELSLATIKLEKGYQSIGIIRDISTRKDLEEKNKKLLEEKDLILKEVHHRIKNNMNTIVSLLSLQAFSTKDKAAVSALEDAGSRVQNMMILYDKLYRSESYDELSIKEYLDSVLENFNDSFHVGKDLEIVKNIEDVLLRTKVIQTLGIIINELLSNIVKYAFTNGEKKIIAVLVKKIGEDLLIEIQDNGKGMPEKINFENTTGFGLTLVGNLVEQLNGSVKIIREHGTKISMYFTNIYK